MSNYWYLSGPMTGYDEWNFPLFMQASTDLRENWGLKIFNPAEVDEFLGLEPDSEVMPRKECLRRDYAILLNVCNGIILLPEWYKSVGAVGELYVSLELEYPAYQYQPPEGENKAGRLTPFRAKIEVLQTLDVEGVAAVISDDKFGAD